MYTHWISLTLRQRQTAVLEADETMKKNNKTTTVKMCDHLQYYKQVQRTVSSLLTYLLFNHNHKSRPAGHSNRAAEQLNKRMAFNILFNGIKQTSNGLIRSIPFQRLCLKVAHWHAGKVLLCFSDKPWNKEPGEQALLILQTEIETLSCTEGSSTNSFITSRAESQRRSTTSFDRQLFENML